MSITEKTKQDSNMPKIVKNCCWYSRIIRMKSVRIIKRLMELGSGMKRKEKKWTRPKKQQDRIQFIFSPKLFLGKKWTINSKRNHLTGEKFCWFFKKKYPSIGRMHPVSERSDLCLLLILSGSGLCIYKWQILLIQWAVVKGLVVAGLHALSPLAWKA